jgi:hypothetical protein
VSQCKAVQQAPAPAPTPPLGNHHVLLLPPARSPQAPSSDQTANPAKSAPPSGTGNPPRQPKPSHRRHRRRRERKVARVTAAQLTPSRPPPRSPRPQQQQDHMPRRRRRPRIIALRTSSRSGAPHGRSYTPRRHIIRTTRRRRSAHTCSSSCMRSRSYTRVRTARMISARACVVVRRTCARARGSVHGFARRTTRSTRCSGSRRLIVRAWMSGGGMGLAMGAVIRAGAGLEFVYSI